MISIIAPVFNEEDYISEMIKSILAQNHPDWELLFVDDGSTDKTADIIEHWAQKDQRIHLVSLRKKLGKVAAFNTAFAAAQGDLICHVGGDDTLPTSSLSDRAQAFRGAPALSVTLGKLQPVDHRGQKTSPPIPRGPKGSQSSPGATYSRALADLIFPIPAELPSEDIWLGNAAVACSAEIIHLQTSIINYRIHKNNSNPRHKSFEAMSEAISARLRAYDLLLLSSLPLTPEFKYQFALNVTTEQLRYRGNTIKLLTLKTLPLVERLALASMSNPLLWKARQRLGLRVTGWRGK